MATKPATPAKALAASSPVVVPVEYLALTRDAAIALNAKQFPTDDVGPAAASFRSVASPTDTARAVRCLTEAIYYEAASEIPDGQRAVAQVVLNRVRNPGFPNSVCGVVYQGSDRPTGCQFTFTCDGSLFRGLSQRAWLRAERGAKAALAGSVFKPVGYATHYHADWVVPYWASSLTRATSIGAHLFYRWKGPWGKPMAFTQQYAGHEPAPWLDLGQSQPLAPPQLANPSGFYKLDGDKPGNVIEEDKVKATLTPAANRALNGSTLRIDDILPQLIPSLEVKPRIKSEPSPTFARSHKP